MAVIHGTNIETNAVPSLDLRFADRKSLVDTISGKNLISFSRSSSGTYYGADDVLKTASTNQARFDHNPVSGESLGLLVEEARTNLVTYSTDFGGTEWSKTNVTAVPNAVISPDGTLTGIKLYFDGANSYVSKQVTQSISSGQSLTYSAWVWSDNKALIGFRIADTATGTTQSFQSVSLTSTPQRVSVTVTASTTIGTWSITLDNRVGQGGDQLSGNVFAWGAQLEAGSFPTSYIPTAATFTGRSSTATYYDASGVIQTAASGVARDDAYFPDENGVMRPAGLLLEAAGTNLVTYGSSIQNWSNTGSWNIVSANATTAPDGTITATSIIPNVGQPSQMANPVSNNEKVLSVFAKANGYNHLIIVAQSAPNTSAGVLFNLTGSGSIVATNYGATGIIQSLPNGWYRCTMVRSASDAATMNTFSLRTADSSTPTDSYWSQPGFAGNGTSGIYLWGAQLEAGSYPTSYIPTVASTVTRAADTSTSATVTRSADVAQITGSNFSSWYNQIQGSFFVGANHKGSSHFNNATFLKVNNGTTNNQIKIFSVGADPYLYITDTAAVQAYIDAGSVSVGLPNKYAAGFTINNFALSVNGATAVTDASGTNPTGMTQLAIGARLSGVGQPNGTISRLTYYPQRLQDSTLQKLTE